MGVGGNNDYMGLGNPIASFYYQYTYPDGFDSFITGRTFKSWPGIFKVKGKNNATFAGIPPHACGRPKVENEIPNPECPIC
jgi:hypothetical protein